MADELSPWEQWKAQQLAAKDPHTVKGPEIGSGEAVARGIERGATLDWTDELKGLGAVSGTPRGTPLLARTAIGGLRLLWGDPQAKETYREARDQSRQRNYFAEQQHPGKTLASQVAGGLATPMPVAAISGARLLPMVGRLGAAGAVTGGLQAAGEAEGTPDAGGVGVGAGIGGVVGGALPVAGRVAYHTLAQPANYVRNVLNPQGGANRAIGQAAQEQARLPAAGQRTALTQAEMLATPEARLVDTLGVPGQTLARSASNMSPEARGIMQPFTAERAAGRQQRNVAQIDEMFGGEPSAALRERTLTTGRRQADPMYDFARRQGNVDLTQGVEGSPGLVTLLERSPDLQRAARKAEGALRSEYAGQEQAWPGIRNLEYWDQVKRQLDDQIGVAHRAGAGETVRNLTGVKNALVQRLDRMVKGYAEAREFAHQYLGSGRAVQAGEQLFGRTQDLQQAIGAFRRLNPEDQQLFKQGLMDRVRTMASRDQNFWNKIERNVGNLNDKLRSVLTPDEYAQLQARSHIERIMQATHNELAGNSSTARQWMQRGLASTAGAGLGYGVTPGGQETPYGPLLGGGLGMGTLGAIGPALMAMQDRRMATLIARGLMTRDTELLNRVAAAAARTDSGVRMLRDLTRRLAMSTTRAATPAADQEANDDDQ